MVVAKSPNLSIGSNLIKEMYFPTHIYYQNLPGGKQVNKYTLS